MYELNQDFKKKYIYIKVMKFIILKIPLDSIDIIKQPKNISYSKSIITKSVDFKNSVPQTDIIAYVAVTSEKN